ncbi:hypothetical protein LZ578_06080 [Jeotgalibaca sp. MA1X17-3]|uniref:hypothetical protein n=1 Tax=Jeotgalibaca sp. MA1X17-3 TaxID=2908211 RepID=UPI001F337518|nr:hypothetical protein [Jeotgalibaca sp. MA1X17-3]UJF14629.1 hypothetical protein LZ578_06080 [Jeotgalibaca sp. MA1X17-3]
MEIKILLYGKGMKDYDQKESCCWDNYGNKSTRRIFFSGTPSRRETFFPFELIDTEDRSPMGIIMKRLLQHVTISSDSLRLMDLTNIKEEDSKTPLFVFDIVETPANPDTILIDSDVMFWRRAKDLKYLWDECNFEGVPIYHAPQLEMD